MGFWLLHRGHGPIHYAALDVTCVTARWATYDGGRDCRPLPGRTAARTWRPTAPWCGSAFPAARPTEPRWAGSGRWRTAYGSGLLQLTSRGSLQVRGLADPVPDAFVAGITAAGFLPSTTHERVRNIVASPFTGLHGGRADLRPMVVALDEALRAAADLAELSGRFLFALDDGRGDVITLPFDVGLPGARPRPRRDPERRSAAVGECRRGRVPALIDAARAAAGSREPLEPRLSGRTTRSAGDPARRGR